MSVIEDARAEFERQARELIATVAEYPDAIREQAILAEIKRFEGDRYNLTRGASVDILRAAL